MLKCFQFQGKTDHRDDSSRSQQKFRLNHGLLLLNPKGTIIKLLLPNSIKLIDKALLSTSACIHEYFHDKKG